MYMYMYMYTYVAHQIKDVSPALQCDQLEHRQHADEKVVERSEAIVGTQFPVNALTSGRTLVMPKRSRAALVAGELTHWDRPQDTCEGKVVSP